MDEHVKFKSFPTMLQPIKSQNQYAIIFLKKGFLPIIRIRVKISVQIANSNAKIIY